MHWDGLDRYGEAAPPGPYSIRLLQTDGLRSDLVANVGINPEPFWQTGVGNHRPPDMVAVDADGITLIPGNAEGGHQIARIGPDRSYLWTGGGLHHGYMGSAAVTTDGWLLVLANNGTLHHLNLETGERLQDRAWSAQWDEDPDERDKGGVRQPLSDLSMDAHAGVVVVSYRRHDTVRWFDLETGNLLGELREIPSPLGVAMASEDRALVISEGGVWDIDLGRKTKRLFIAPDGLEAPWRLSVDRERGEVVLAENSAATGWASPRHQVKRFDRNGQLLAAYGEPEGRQDGTYVATDFFGITDIASTPDGGFVVAEPNAPPRRVARFDRDGEVVMDFYGAVPYATSAAPEPDDPRRVWYSTGSGLVRAAVDYETNSWTLLETYHHGIRRNPLVSLQQHLGKGVKVFRSGNHLYVNSFDGNLFVHDPSGPSLRASNAIGIRLVDSPEWQAEAFQDEKAPYPVRTGILWSDVSGDGMPERSELSLFDSWEMSRTGHRVAFFQEDLSMVLTSGHRIPPASITEAGTPVYDTAAIETLPVAAGAGIYGNADGEWYRSIRAPLRGERHGIYWWPGLSGTSRLYKHDAEGNLIWEVGRHTATWDSEPGWSHGFEGIVGEVRDCIVVDGNFVDTELVGPMVWTTDGLFVGDLVIHPGGNLPESIYYGSRNENPQGSIVEDAQTGEVFFFVHGNSSAPVFRIDGWNDWKRAEASFEVTAPAPVAVAEGTGLQAEYFANPGWEGAPAAERIDERVYFNWNTEPAAEDLPLLGFSARWSGVVEAPLSETFMLVLRTGSNHRHQARSPLVRLWVNGEKVIDSGQRLGLEPRNYTQEFWRAPVPMEAGKRYAIRIEYADRSEEKPVAGSYLQLCWESPTVERQSIESRYLYPDAALANTGEGVEAPAGDPRLAGRLLPVTSELPQTVTPDGLIAHFQFKEPDGLIAFSEVGAAVHGTFHGEVVRVPGRIGNALRFEGGMCSISPELRMPHTDYTIAFWFKTESDTGRLVSVNRKPTFHNNYNENILSLKNGRVHLRLGREESLSKERFDDGAWHYAALVVEAGAGSRFYINNKLVFEGKADRMGYWHLWHVPTEKLGMRVGPGSAGSVITMDDLRVYKRPLSEEDLKGVSTRVIDSLAGQGE